MIQSGRTWSGIPSAMHRNNLFYNIINQNIYINVTPCQFLFLNITPEILGFRITKWWSKRFQSHWESDSFFVLLFKYSRLQFLPTTQILTQKLSPFAYTRAWAIQRGAESLGLRGDCRAPFQLFPPTSHATMHSAFSVLWEHRVWSVMFSTEISVRRVCLAHSHDSVNICGTTLNWTASEKSFCQIYITYPI